MGVVWHAEDMYLPREVAIKEILVPGASAGESDPMVSRALREASAAARLRHPGIVIVHDLIHDDGRPWIVMEFLDGPSLASLIESEGALSEHRAAGIGIQVLRALHAAHSRGILHRDVKPSNIKLDGERVVLTDFGIAAIDGATVLTKTGQLIGTMAYIAPERIAGREATAADDLWAVGVTLYNMVVGQSPFQRTNPSATLYAVLNEDPAPHPNIDRLGPVIDGLLRKDPADRLGAEAAIAMLAGAEPEAVPPLPRMTARWTPDRDATRVDPQAEVTEPAATQPNTRIAAPMLPPPEPPTEAPVRPGDVTIVPDLAAPPEPRNRGRAALISACVAVAVLVAGLIVWLSRPGPDDRQAGSVASDAPTAGSTTSMLPEFREYRERLGFSISVPRDWLRSASPVGSQLSDVAWHSQPGETTGGMVVQVRRDTTKPVTDATSYLSDKERAERDNGDFVDYQRIGLDRTLPAPDDAASAARLEYTRRQRAGNVHYHDQIRVFVTRRQTVYLLTFSVYAGDSRALQAQWQSAQPILARIADSFHVTG